MAKIDKEALAKNKFWIALGAFLLLWAIGFLTLRMSAAAPYEAKKKAYDEAEKGIASVAGSAKNRENFLTPWQEHGEKYRKHKDTVWKQAWEAQKDLLRWPAARNDPYGQMWARTETFGEWKKAAEANSSLRADYGRKIGGHYLAQFQLSPEDLRAEAAKKAEAERTGKPAYIYTYALEKQLAPVEFKGGGEGFAALMCPATGGTPTGNDGTGMPGPGGGKGMPGPGAPVLPGPGKPGPGMPGPGMGPGMGTGGKTIATLWAQDKSPTAEELWLAQEDYSVKYELLQVVRRTVDSVARLQRKTEFKDAAPAKVVFRNSQWELTLHLQQEGGNRVIGKDSTIKNVSPSPALLSNPRTKGPLVFRLTQAGNPNTYDLKVAGEPLAAGAETTFGTTSTVDSIDTTRAFEMTQVMDWSVSPIRRIDDIRLGYHSHRTANVPLVASKHFPAPEVDPTAAPAGDATGGGMPGPTPSSAGPSPGAGGYDTPGAGGVGGAAGPVTTTDTNGLNKNRYLHVTGQARSLPFAMTVVLEQNHMHDFLVELANSQLRVQITQVHFHRVRDVLSLVEASTSGATGTGGMEGGPGRPGPMLPGPGLPGPGLPGPGLPGSGMPGQTAAVVPDPNLVELSVYGIATLYEKFTLKKDEPAPDMTNPMPN